MKKLLFALLFSFVCALSFSQGIITAREFFDSVSAAYEEINDYEAEMDISIGDDSMHGRVSFKKPNLLRIDFTEPAEQVVVFNGTDLTIYLPDSAAILNQNVTSSDEESASSSGLALMNRYYSIAYETGQTPVPLDEDSPELVVNLLLTRRSTTESFSTITLSITPSTHLIRRVTAVTSQDVRYVFDFLDYNINPGISDQRFIYDAPSSANNYNNFLLSE